MNRRPIGLNHGEWCDSGDWEWLCDDCRFYAAQDAEPDCDTDGDES